MEALKGCKTRIEFEVQFRDCDLLGHVNNSVYLTYLENARVAYCFGPLEVRDWRSFEFIVARVEIDYRSPAIPGESLICGVRVSRVGGASFDMQYVIIEKKTGRLVAEARTVQVCFDYSSNKVRRVPEALRDKVRQHDGIS